VTPAPATRPHSARPYLAPGLRAIVIYKFVKAALMTAAAIALWAGVRVGLATWLARVALDLGEHAVHPLLARLCQWLSLAFAPGRVVLLELLLLGDAILSVVEGWALRRGHAWGRWLVVLATGALLPLEVFELFRHPRWSRALVLVVNALIVLYLVRRMRRHADAAENDARLLAERCMSSAALSDP
jgi:uncharacterized membrane protein (DUF2068 family)